jgi:hypothetical protein
MADWTLPRDHVHAIRDTRAALLSAAGTGSAAVLETAVTSAVRAMVAADFARATICSLVSAAVDSGLPRRRNYARRADDVQYWTQRAATLVDALTAESERQA